MRRVGEAEAVEQAPDDEGPADSMPQAAEQHDYDGVHVVRALPLAGTGQGEVKVVAEPVGEGDVPAAPDVGDGDGPIRPIEIVR